MITGLKCSKSKTLRREHAIVVVLGRLYRDTQMNYFRPLRSMFFVLVLVGLAGCGANPRVSSVSVNGVHLLKMWRCETPEARIAAEARNRDGTLPTVADKLLECPFHRDFQIEAMQRTNAPDVSYDQLSEIVYKMRWGIDFQYRAYEEYILKGPKRHLFVPRFLNRVVPGLSDLMQLSVDLVNEPVELGKASGLVVRQMQGDRVRTGNVIERRMAAYRDKNVVYPLWQMIIDLDAYFEAGTAFSALDSLNKKMFAINKSMDDI